jgi:multicomponent Na+:H+ antiporter subunit A
MAFAPDAGALLLAVALPFVAAGAVPFVYRVVGERVAYLGALVALVCFGLLASQYGVEGVVSFPWVPTLGMSLTFYLDGLSLLVGFLASGVGVLVFTYSAGYMHGESGLVKYYASMLVFMGSMLGLVLAADLIVLFVFWELTSLSSFALIGHYQREADSQYAARKSMLITVAGGLFLLVGFVLLYAVSGEALAEPTYALVTADGGGLLQNAGAIRETLADDGIFLAAICLVAVGAGAKSAQVPLHVWLPNAMEAPTPVSAFLHSATMVKAGVYLVGRFRPLLLAEGAIPQWELVFVAVGLTTMTIAAMLAVTATDIKELLAYSTASHLGLIVAGFGFASNFGAEAGAFHILNHATFKAALFLVAGIIAHEAGTRKLSELGGLRRDLPVTAVVAVVAALGMSGVPLFNGFFSKELLFEAAFHAAEEAGGFAWVVPVVAVFGSVFTFLYSIRFLMLFFGEKPTGLGEVHRPPVAMVAPPVLLAGLALVGGLRPNLAIDVVAGDAFRATAFAPGAGAEKTFSVKFPTSLKPQVVMSAVTIAVGTAAYPFYDRIHRALRELLAFSPLRANAYYDGGVDGLTGVSVVSIPEIQTGLLRTYVSWAVGAFAVLALGGYAAAGVAVPAVTGAGPGITPAVVVVLVLATLAAVAMTRAPSHIAGVLTLSIVGFMIAIFYILASAPDLALTQLLIETLVLVIFLLVLDRLPAFYGEIRRSRAVRDGALSVLVGATVFVTVLVSTAQSPALDLRRFLVDRAGLPSEHGPVLADWGGGGNIVNVVLVDFRAFDTMGEISVVAMAALSVLTLIGMRERGETQ